MTGLALVSLLVDVVPVVATPGIPPGIPPPPISGGPPMLPPPEPEVDAASVVLDLPLPLWVMANISFIERDISSMAWVWSAVNVS